MNDDGQLRSHENDHKNDRVDLSVDKVRYSRSVWKSRLQSISHTPQK